MRIGMILDKAFPPDPRVENEALALIGEGHELFLFCLNYNKEQAEESLHGIEVKRYPASVWTYKLSALSYSLPFYRWVLEPRISRFLSDWGIEVLHVHDMVVARAALDAGRKAGIPLVLDLHENRPEIMKTYPHLNKLPGKLLISPEKWMQAEQRLVLEFDRILVVTEEARRDLLERTGKEPGTIVVVPNTVRKSFYDNPRIKKEITHRYREHFVILYLGDTGLRRGLLTAIEALPALSNSIARLKLVIVGSSSTDPLLQDKVRELGIDKLVDFEGWISEKDFPSYLEASKICISPLYRNKHHDTTYANKLFQYMAFSRPIVASDALAQKQLIEASGSGLVHKERDAEDFAEKCLQLFADEKRRIKLGENGRRFVMEEFAWERVSSGLKQLYADLDRKMMTKA